MKYLNRDKIIFKPLSERINRVSITDDSVSLNQKPNIDDETKKNIELLAKKIKYARENDKPVVMAFGAHAIKNGLSLLMIELIKNNFITHLATNGAGIIHDWEFAYLGESSENVHENVMKGEFGIWEETTFYLNLAILAGSYEGLGYGESVGKFILEEGVAIESVEKLKKIAIENMESNFEKSASALDFAEKIKKFNLKESFLHIKHKYKKYSIQSEAYRLKIPFTAHPMFGHDIIYTHPMSTGSAIGRTAERDFLSFAKSIENLEEGVYLSIGSAVMSPMIFEKSLSMARNIKLQENKKIENFDIFVVDLAKTTHDWSKGEPDEQDPAYYLRYMKTFSRMGGRVKYISANNIDFILALLQILNK